MEVIRDKLLFGYPHSSKCLLVCSRWRRVWQPCCELRENFAVFCVFYFVFLLFYVLDVVCITVYDRHTLLNIGSSVAQCKPDFRVLECWCFVHRHRIRALRLGCKTEKTQAEKREESWRPRQTETPCFPTSSSNHFAG